MHKNKDNHRYLNKTYLLDYESASIQKLIASHNWLSLSLYDRIGAAYDYVRNEIEFGYNEDDNIKASKVLSDGYGQCNTKCTLLIALFRALGIASRLRGSTIHKSLQRGVVPEVFYAIAPTNIIHSWVQIYYKDRWINLEGFILDDKYISILQDEFADENQSLCAYGIGTNNLSEPKIHWSGKDTYIQRTGINQDFGIFDTPDDYYANHKQEFGIIKEFVYRFFVRHLMNQRVKKMRQEKQVPIIPNGPDEAPIVDLKIAWEK